MIRFSSTIFYVSDVANSIAFYERAFGLKIKFIHPDGDYGELDTGATCLTFASYKMALSNLEHGFMENPITGKPCAMHIGFTAENVEETYRHAVSEGAIPEFPPEFNSNGQTVAFLRDLEGFLIELSSPLP